MLECPFCHEHVKSQRRDNWFECPACQNWIRLRVNQNGSRWLEAGYFANDEIDGLITSAAANWRIERMALVDRNILRLGAFEICHSPDVPFVVAINEAVELAKRFGSDESGGFINGILDKISEITRKKKGQA